VRFKAYGLNEERRESPCGMSFNKLHFIDLIIFSGAAGRKEPAVEKGPVERKARQVVVERNIGVTILISASSRISGIRRKAITDCALCCSLVISASVEISRPVQFLRKM
jgi:hypothetical protein